MKKLLKLSLGLAALLFAAVTASAQLVFSFTGTVTANTSASSGYTLGQSVTFAFVIDPAVVGNHAPLQAADWRSQWTYSNSAVPPENPIWSALLVGGLTGSLVPAPAFQSLTTEMQVGRRDSLYFTAYGSPSGIGLSNQTGQAVTGISAYFFVTAFSYSNDPSSPVDFFANAHGTYSVLNGNSQIGFADGSVSFTVASITIGTTVPEIVVSGGGAIPEPSTYAAFAGAAALGWVALARRRRSNVAAM